MTTHPEPRLCPITAHEIGPDRYAAPAAAGRLRATLADLPALMVELETTLTRQVRMGASVGSGGDERLPFNLEASERGWALRMTLLVWVDELAHRRPRMACPACAGMGAHDDGTSCEACNALGTVAEPIPTTWQTIADSLMAWSDWMTTLERGAQAIDEILDAHHHALRAIDRPADRTYAGPCPTCHGDVYGKPDAPTVRCSTCGTERDLADARQVMLDQLALMHLPAVDAARAVSLLTGREVTAAMVRRWKHRGLIEPTETNTAGQPLYDLTALALLAAPERIGA